MNAANETKIKEMLKNTSQRDLDAGIPMKSNTYIEIETGDQAVTWVVLTHINSVDKILSIRRDFREFFLKTSPKYSVELTTPIIHLARQ